MRLTAGAAPSPASPALRVISQPQPTHTAAFPESSPGASGSARFCQLFVTVCWYSQKAKKNMEKWEGELYGAEHAPGARYCPRHATCARHRYMSPHQPAMGPRPTPMRDLGTLSGASTEQGSRCGCSGAPENGSAPTAPVAGLPADEPCRGMRSSRAWATVTHGGPRATATAGRAARVRGHGNPATRGSLCSRPNS